MNLIFLAFIMTQCENCEILAAPVSSNQEHLSNRSSYVDDDVQGYYRMSRDWLIPEFLGKLIPSTPLFSTTQVEETESLAPAPNNSSNFLSSILPRLFTNLIIDRPSLFRVQFYNSDFEDTESPDNDNSTEPNAVFGSPLCIGLCIPVQVFSENTSIHLLSDKQISLLPPGPDPTPLYNVSPGAQTKSKPINSSVVESLESSTNSTLGWLYSWIPATPSFFPTQNNIQLPYFPQLTSGTSSLVG